MNKKLEVIDGKQTNWCGLWWNPDTNSFKSSAFSLSELRKFKGAVRLIVRKNKFFNNGENNRPNYNFVIRDAAADAPIILEIEDIEEQENSPYCEDGVYYDEKGNRLYTYSEVQTAINGAVEDGRNGYGRGDVIVSDYV